MLRRVRRPRFRTVQQREFHLRLAAFAAGCSRAFPQRGDSSSHYAGTLVLWDLDYAPPTAERSRCPIRMSASRTIPSRRRIRPHRGGGRHAHILARPGWKTAHVESQRKNRGIQPRRTRVLASREKRKTSPSNCWIFRRAGKRFELSARCDKIESFFSADDRLEQIVATSTQPSDGEPKLRKVVLWRPAKKAPSELTIPLSESVEDACFDPAGRVLCSLVRRFAAGKT